METRACEHIRDGDGARLLWAGVGGDRDLGKAAILGDRAGMKIWEGAVPQPRSAGPCGNDSNPALSLHSK